MTYPRAPNGTVGVAERVEPPDEERVVDGNFGSRLSVSSGWLVVATGTGVPQTHPFVLERQGGSWVDRSADSPDLATEVGSSDTSVRLRGTMLIVHRTRQNDVVYLRRNGGRFAHRQTLRLNNSPPGVAEMDFDDRYLVVGDSEDSPGGQAASVVRYDESSDQFEAFAPLTAPFAVQVSSVALFGNLVPNGDETAGRVLLFAIE